MSDPNNKLIDPAPDSAARSDDEQMPLPTPAALAPGHAGLEPRMATVTQGAPTTSSSSKTSSPLPDPSGVAQHMAQHVTDLQGPPSERTQTEKLWDLKKLAQHYTRDRGSCDDVQISYLETLEDHDNDNLRSAQMLAG
jgi:hypothetical protein